MHIFVKMKQRLQLSKSIESARETAWWLIIDIFLWKLKNLAKTRIVWKFSTRYHWYFLQFRFCLQKIFYITLLHEWDSYHVFQRKKIAFCHSNSGHFNRSPVYFQYISTDLNGDSKRILQIAITNIGHLKSGYKWYDKVIRSKIHYELYNMKCKIAIHLNKFLYLFQNKTPECEQNIIWIYWRYDNVHWFRRSLSSIWL